MGYCTEYKLTIPKEFEEFIDEIELSLDFSIRIRDSFTSATKWYSHVEDLAKLSKKYPEILFTLEGVGEEFPDIWVKYFKNGKFQTSNATITFEPFDENKLRDLK